jgi:hypothetical protein
MNFSAFDRPSDEDILSIRNGSDRLDWLVKEISSQVVPSLSRFKQAKDLNQLTNPIELYIKIYVFFTLKHDELELV